MPLSSSVPPLVPCKLAGNATSPAAFKTGVSVKLANWPFPSGTGSPASAMVAIPAWAADPDEHATIPTETTIASWGVFVICPSFQGLWLAQAGWERGRILLLVKHPKPRAVMPASAKAPGSWTAPRAAAAARWRPRAFGPAQRSERRCPGCRRQPLLQRDSVADLDESRKIDSGAIDIALNGNDVARHEKCLPQTERWKAGG